jgi:hypothetical protein
MASIRELTVLFETSHNVAKYLISHQGWRSPTNKAETFDILVAALAGSGELPVPLCKLDDLRLVEGPYSHRAARLRDQRFAQRGAAGSSRQTDQGLRGIVLGVGIPGQQPFVDTKESGHPVRIRQQPGFQSTTTIRLNGPPWRSAARVARCYWAW